MAKRTVRMGVGVGVGLVVAGAALAFGFGDGGDAQAEPRVAAKGGVPVVVELFSSEGCSSCPPADAYLERLDRTQGVAGAEVVVLQMDVDYWDELGWADAFAKPEYSARQRRYAAVLDDHRTYTPEIVVAGADTVQGGDETQAATLIADAARRTVARVDVERSTTEKRHVAIHVSGVPAATGAGVRRDKVEVWLAVTERGLASKVTRGENAGRTLRHAPIVRSLRRVGEVDAARGAFDGEIDVSEMAAAVTNAKNAQIVVFAQEAAGRRIVAAGVIDGM